MPNTEETYVLDVGYENFRFLEPNEKFTKGLDTPIFRYVPVDRFLEMVEDGANTLSHLSLWEDPFEAFLIRSAVREGEAYGQEGTVQSYYDLYKGIYGQSWTLKEDESDVFWRAYGKRGETVRISSTIGRLCKGRNHLRITRFKCEHADA